MNNLAELDLGLGGPGAVKMEMVTEQWLGEHPQGWVCSEERGWETGSDKAHETAAREPKGACEFAGAAVTRSPCALLLGCGFHNRNQSSHGHGDQGSPEGRICSRAEAPILWPPDGKNQLTGKDPDPRKDMLFQAAAPLSSKSPWLLPLPRQPPLTLPQAAGPWPPPPPPALRPASHLLLRLLLQQGPSC